VKKIDTSKTTRQIRTDLGWARDPPILYQEGVAKLLLGSYPSRPFLHTIENQNLRFRLYGAYVGLELLGNSLIVTFKQSSRGLVYSSFFSIEPLSLILLVQPSSRTCTINATKIANSIIEYIRKGATVWHQISGGVERAAVKSGKTIKKRRLLVKVSTERPLGSGKQITITGTWEHTDGMNKIRTVNII